MTEAQQKRFYFPAWNKCAEANDWIMVKGRLLAQRPQAGQERGNGKVRELYQQVWNAAAARALQQHRGVTAEDLRHGCTIVVCKRDKSSGDLTNKEVSRVVHLFDVLRDPENLDAVMKWENPEVGERHDLIAAIKRKAPEEYICAVAKDRFRGQFEYPYWEDLAVGHLRQLAMTLNNRNAGWKGNPEAQRHSAAEPQPNTKGSAILVV